MGRGVQLLFSSLKFVLCHNASGEEPLRADYKRINADASHGAPPAGSRVWIVSPPRVRLARTCQRSEQKEEVEIFSRYLRRIDEYLAHEDDLASCRSSICLWLAV